MRKLLFLVTIALSACGGNGDGVNVMLEPVQHAPEISNLILSPDSALYLEGDGSVQVTAEFAFSDRGQDLETLQVEMSDGTSLTIELAEQVDAVSGTLIEQFEVTTAVVYGCTVEIWLIDKAGQSSNHLSALFTVVRHMPEISDVKLSPDTALYMEGDGNVVVSAEIIFSDAGSDLQTLWVQMPDGTAVEFDEPIFAETGKISEKLNMSTQTVGSLSVEIWLVDTAGDSSVHHTVEFSVIGEVQLSDWTSRLGGLPYALNDVIWDGDAFIAVGGGGAVLTSSDGIDWVARESGTDADLHAVAANGNDIFAVGYEIVLLSTDHGENWAVKHRPAHAGLSAVAVNSSQVVVAGNVPDLFLPRVSISTDRGDTWQEVFFPWGYYFGFFSDLIYKDEIFIAATDSLSSQGRAMVSVDGSVWDEVFYDEEAGLLAIFHDGSKYIASGGNGAVFTSFDGFNWTKAHTVVEDVDYLSGAWNGSKIVIAGGYSWRYYSRRITPEFEVPVGISSTDGGVTWEIFNIDGYYQSRGMAYGNGRFVSVGQSAPVSGEGAIYTAD